MSAARPPEGARPLRHGGGGEGRAADKPGGGKHAIAALSFPNADPKALDAVIQGAIPAPPPVAPAPGIPMNGGMQ